MRGETRSLTSTESFPPVNDYIIEAFNRSTYNVHSGIFLCDVHQACSTLRICSVDSALRAKRESVNCTAFHRTEFSVEAQRAVQHTRALYINFMTCLATYILFFACATDGE
jgi:hypothetical protein